MNDLDAELINRLYDAWARLMMRSNDRFHLSWSRSGIRQLALCLKVTDRTYSAGDRFAGCYVSYLDLRASSIDIITQSIAGLVDILEVKT